MYVIIMNELEKNIVDICNLLDKLQRVRKF